MRRQPAQEQFVELTQPANPLPVLQTQRQLSKTSESQRQELDEQVRETPQQLEEDQQQEVTEQQQQLSQEFDTTEGNNLFTKTKTLTFYP